MANEVVQTQGREMEPRRKQALQQESLRSGWVFRPDVDIVEEAERYLVSADLPGVGEDDVQIQLENGVLSIDAQPSVGPEEAWRPVYGEYRTGSYHREFTMGETIDAENISARVRDGVLEIELPKVARHQPRRIEVTRG